MPYPLAIAQYLYEEHFLQQFFVLKKENFPI